jgi:hypothetical protein
LGFATVIARGGGALGPPHFSGFEAIASRRYLAWSLKVAEVALPK